MRRLIWLGLLALAIAVAARVDLPARNVATVVVNRAFLGAGVPESFVQYESWFRAAIGPALTGSARSRAQGHLALGLIRDRAGDRAGAIEEWRAAGAAPLFAREADRASRGGDWAAALRFWERAVGIEPDRLDYLFAMAHTYWPGLGQPQEAIGIHTRIAGMAAAGSADRALARGFVARLSGRWPEALIEYEAAAAAAPSRADAHRLAALAAATLDDHARAARHLRRAAAIPPEDAAIFIELGDAELAGGDRQAAGAAYRRAVALAPADRLARERVIRLDGLHGR